MSVTIDEIVASGLIACGIQETQDGREHGARGDPRRPLPLLPGDWAHPDALLIHVDMLAASSSPHDLSRKWSVRRNSQGNVDLCASLQDISDEDMARSRRRGVSPTCQQNCYVLYSIM